MTTMDEKVEIRFRWTAEMLLSAYRWHSRQRFPKLVRVAFWLFVAFMISWGAWRCWERGFDSGGTGLIGGLYIVGYLKGVRPWLVRRQFAKRPDCDEMLHWQVDGVGLKGGYAHGSGEMTWASFVKVVATPEGFLLYPTPDIFNWFPRAGFANEADMERFSRLAEAKAATFRRIA